MMLGTRGFESLSHHGNSLPEALEGNLTERML